MAIAAVVNFNNNVDPGIRFGPADHWDAYSESMNQNVFGGKFQGYFENWGGFDEQSANSPFFNKPYSGYNTNWNGISSGAIENTVVNTLYAGYNTNWGSYPEPIQESINDVDKDSIINYPKSQTIFYKLRGWNAGTSSYETWVVSHNTTGRPSLDGGLFDPIPGNSPPNVERDVFKTPPSGNTLTNIILVAKWIE